MSRELSWARFVLRCRPGIGAVPIVCDVAEPGAAEQVVSQAAERLGTIDVLVNNAGTNGPGGPLLARSVEEWWDVLRTNLYGPMGRYWRRRFVRLAGPG